MITDRIKFKPGFAKEDSKTFASGGVEVKGIEPDRLWRNLTNISAWPRYSEAIVDINFEDTGTNDPHLYDKAQFNYDLANGMHVVAQVIFFQHPKEDRPGRLAYQGTVFNADGKCINEMVGEFLVGVPDGRREILELCAAVSAKEEAPDADKRNFGDELLSFLDSLAAWSVKHD